VVTLNLPVLSRRITISEPTGGASCRFKIASDISVEAAHKPTKLDQGVCKVFATFEVCVPRDLQPAVLRIPYFAGPPLMALA
jgi:hypothetical protein